LVNFINLSKFEKEGNMVSKDKTLYNNEEKLNYVLKKLNLTTKEIAKKLEISTGLVSQIQNHYNGKLRKVHLYAISNAYDIPMDIFEDESINLKSTIDYMLKQASFRIFEQDYKLLEKLIGRWYLYSYPSNQNLAKIWSTETHIYDDFTVLDAHRNRGRLYIGKKQSIIIKESNNSQNITTTVFDNDRVTYGNFPFSRIAKSNSFNREILSFGFFSRKEIPKDRAKEILGEVEKVQLQMDYSVIDRVSGSIEMRG
jgi:transcriptional regulator with XRE-family HTH domain